MPTNVLLPQWGMGMQEGTVIEWLKQEGDVVAEEEPIVEVESEKTTDTVKAPVAGRLSQIVVPAGQIAQIYDVLAVVLAPDEQPPGEDQGAPAPAADSAPAPGQPTAATPAPAADRPARQIEPRARRAASELGVDLESVDGTGPGGRVTEEDVRGIGAKSSEGRRIRLTGVRAVTARRMAEAARTIPMVTLTREIDAAELLAAKERHGAPVAVTDLIVKAAAGALSEHPGVNAHFDEDSLVLFDQAHIGVAVSTDNGLMVPVIRDAGSKTVTAIAETRRRLTNRVLEGQITLDEVKGGTFTITNLGMFGISAFTPIVNPPEIAILGVGRIEERLARRDDGIAWHPAMTLSLTFDHRAVDGAPAAKFLASLADRLEGLSTEG